jgi:hypothetical protein
MSSRALPSYFSLDTFCHNLPTLLQSIIPLVLIPLALLVLFTEPLEAQQLSTAALAITSNDTPATSTTQGTVATLAGTVSQSVSPVALGQVAFCDAAAPFCTDIRAVGYLENR